MPNFPLTVRREAFNDESITTDAHKRCQNSISALSDEEEKPSVRGGKSNDFVEVHDEVGEPNSGAQVVEDMARGVRDSLAQRSTILPLRRVFGLCKAAKCSF